VYHLFVLGILLQELKCFFFVFSLVSVAAMSSVVCQVSSSSILFLMFHVKIFLCLLVVSISLSHVEVAFFVTEVAPYNFLRECTEILFFFMYNNCLPIGKYAPCFLLFNSPYSFIWLISSSFGTLSNLDLFLI
jgi:hypothetical protein